MTALPSQNSQNSQFGQYSPYNQLHTRREQKIELWQRRLQRAREMLAPRRVPLVVWHHGSDMAAQMLALVDAALGDVARNGAGSQGGE